MLAKDDFAAHAIDLADLASAVALMPTFLEAEHIDVEPKSAVYIGDEEHRPRVPPVNSCSRMAVLVMFVSGLAN